MRWFALWFYLFTGCATTESVHGVPNLHQIGPGVWRSGQPRTPEAWAYLQSIGIKRVVKLNFRDEGSDEEATRLGIQVFYLPIQPHGDLASVFELPDADYIQQALLVMSYENGVLVHCTHGEDRTGLVVGLYRVNIQNLNRSDAWLEMIKNHFHPELVGLMRFWEDYGDNR